MSQEERARRRQARTAEARSRRVSIVGLRRASIALLLAGTVAISFALFSRFRPKSDPTRYGPERALSLDAATIEVQPAGRKRLVARGETNLPDGTLIDVSVGTTEPIFTTTAACTAGRWEVAVEQTGTVTNGRYSVNASFALEKQPSAVRAALHYQPRQLSADRTLEVTTGVDPKALRAEVHALIAAANNAREPAALGPVAERTRALEQELWISSLIPSVRCLGRAVEVALRTPRPLNRDELGRRLVKPDVLAGP